MDSIDLAPSDTRAVSTRNATCHEPGHTGLPARVTVCVVVKDRLAMMRECLQGLAVQEGVDFEFVIIDNGSTDGTYEMLVEHRATFPVPMRVERVTGPLGGARQAAVDLARAPIVAFTDSDCVPAPDWLARLVEPFEADDVDVVQGRTDPAVEPDGRWPKTIRVDGWTGRYETCNIAYRTESLRAAGGFDRSGEIGGEDTTAGWRVQRLGRRHVYADEALVHHAVTYPGLRWHHRFARDLAMWPQLVREFPELRKSLLYRGFFLRRRSAAFDLATLGAVLLAMRKPAGALLLLPYARMLRPAYRADGARGAVDVVSYDVNTAIGLIAGSCRHRTVVL